MSIGKAYLNSFLLATIRLVLAIESSIEEHIMAARLSAASICELELKLGLGRGKTPGNLCHHSTNTY